MTTGLLTQLADYGAYHDEEQGNVELADVLAVLVLLPSLVETQLTGWEQTHSTVSTS